MKLGSLTEIVQAAEGVYREHFQDKAEKYHKGEFVVIDVNAKKAYFGIRPIEAHRNARRENPNGLCHLMKVGKPAAFKFSHFHQQPSDDRSSWQWVL